MVLLVAWLLQRSWFWRLRSPFEIAGLGGGEGELRFPRGACGQIQPIFPLWLEVSTGLARHTVVFSRDGYADALCRRVYVPSMLSSGVAVEWFVCAHPSYIASIPINR